MSAPVSVADIRAVLIDLDGTLLDTVGDLAAATNAVLAEFDRPALALERISTFVGKGADVLLHRALTDSMEGRVGDATHARARAAFDRHYARENGLGALPYPGVVEGLAAMRAMGLPLVCVTNKPIAFTVPLLERTGLSPWFAFSLGGDSLPQRKPHPLPLLHAAQRLQVEPGQCLMLGDSINDALAARAAHMPVWLVPYGYNEGEPLDRVDCDGIVDTLAQAAALIASARRAAQPARQDGAYPGAAAGAVGT